MPMKSPKPRAFTVLKLAAALAILTVAGCVLCDGACARLLAIACLEGLAGGTLFGLVAIVLVPFIWSF